MIYLFTTNVRAIFIISYVGHMFIVYMYVLLCDGEKNLFFFFKAFYSPHPHLIQGYFQVNMVSICQVSVKCSYSLKSKPMSRVLDQEK